MGEQTNSPKYTKIPNDLLGDIARGNKVIPGLLANLEGAEVKVLLAVYRLTLGFHQDERRASFKTMMDLTGLSKPGVWNAAKSLEEHGLIKRSLDGGVTLWKVLVNSVNHQEKDYGQAEVNLGNQAVNSVNRDGKLSLPPSKKETRKKPINRERDYAEDVLAHEQGQEGIATPVSDFEAHFRYRDEALKAYHELTGKWADTRIGKPAIVALSEKSGFNIKRWRSSITSARLAGVRPENIQCFIDTYCAGGEYRNLFEDNAVRPVSGNSSAPIDQGKLKALQRKAKGN